MCIDNLFKNTHTVFIVKVEFHDFYVSLLLVVKIFLSSESYVIISLNSQKLNQVLSGAFLFVFMPRIDISLLPMNFLYSTLLKDGNDDCPCFRDGELRYKKI